ncbi:MAG: tetratricopeptide repeat protein [Myxococcales bacterium]|nr:tetratricopeptide repeat protein [Myxococcales bacterium]
MSARVVAAAMIVLVGLATGARAEHDREARARAHYEVGLGMYHLGNYRDAVREFTAGYDLSPRPEFLINLGQAYRKLHEIDRAREMFRQYLARAPADAPDRPQVRGLLAEVEAERASAAEALPTAAPPTGAPPAPAPATAAPPTAAPAPAEAAAAAVLPPALASSSDATVATTSRSHGLRRWWWTIPVGVAVAGAAVGVTLYFTLRSPQVACSSATIACVDLRP